jgi:hypothetical protein
MLSSHCWPTSPTCRHLRGFLASHTIGPTCVDCRCGGSNIASWEQCGLCSLPYPSMNLPGCSDLSNVLGSRGAFEQYTKLHYGVRQANVMSDKCLSAVLTPLVYKGNMCEGYGYTAPGRQRKFCSDVYKCQIVQGVTGWLLGGMLQ